MGANSIRSNLDSSSIISTLRLALSADIEKRTSYIIVEGEDDFKLLRKFCNENVTIYESYSGKVGVLEIIENSYINDNRIVGIRDRDYYNGELHERLFFYDKSCLEMMILSFDDSFIALYDEFYFGNMNSNDLINNIFDNLFYLSLFRMYSELRNLEIKFKGLSLSNVLDDLVEDSMKLVEELSIRSPNCSICLNTLYSEIAQCERPSSINEYFDIVNGHDFIQLFQKHCNLMSGKKGISDRQISSSLRTSFNFDLFRSTNLYSEIKEYCSISNIAIWTSE